MMSVVGAHMKIKCGKQSNREEESTAKASSAGNNDAKGCKGDKVSDDIVRFVFKFWRTGSVHDEKEAQRDWASKKSR
jgi:hypothetical protein